MSDNPNNPFMRLTTVYTGLPIDDALGPPLGSSVSRAQVLAPSAPDFPPTPTPPAQAPRALMMTPQPSEMQLSAPPFIVGRALTGHGGFSTPGASFTSMSTSSFSDMEQSSIDLSKYRRLAEAHGLHHEQADTAVELAAMTPRSARVALYAQVQVGINLVKKFREQQTKVWSMSEKALNRMHLLVRLSLLAPMPFSWKNLFARLVFKLLLRDGWIPKDIENFPERVTVVNSKISKFASHVRSHMKILIQDSLQTPYTDILHLTKDIVQPCAASVDITREVLAGVAYVRSLVTKEMAERAAASISHTPAASTALARDAWDVLDVRLKADRKDNDSDEARKTFLDDQLQKDLDTYGVYAEDSSHLVSARSSTSLQAAVFEAARKGASRL